MNSSVNVALELENFLREPLSYYSSETDDLFIFALGNYYNFNVVIYHADTTKCWTNFHKGHARSNGYVESGPTLYLTNETQLSDVIYLSETNNDSVI